MEGARARTRLRPGRRRGDGLELPDDRDDRRRQRSARRPARLPPRARRRRVHHRLQPDPLRPGAGGRVGRRRDHRHGDAGDRHAHRARALGMALARPRRAARIGSLRAERTDAVGLLPPQLDRATRRGQDPDLRAQHLGRLRARRRQRARAVATGGQQQLVQDGTGHEDGLAARRAHAPRRRADLLRRRLEPPDPRAVACDPGQARHHRPRSDARVRVHALRPAAARRQPGQRADPLGRQHGRRLRRRARGQRVRARWNAAVRRPPALRHVLLPRFPLPVERAAGEPAGGAREPQQHRRRDDRARELERGDRGRVLARARREREGEARPPRDPSGRRLRGLHHAAGQVPLRRRAGARPGRARARELAHGGCGQLRRRAPGGAWNEGDGGHRPRLLA